MNPSLGTAALISAGGVLLFGSVNAHASDAPGRPALRPIVELEEDVYKYEPANNGAGPLWCRGSTCVFRAGLDVFASGLETLKTEPPLNNCRWMFFHRGSSGWEKVQSDPSGRTREPCPLAGFDDGRLFLSSNPTLQTNRHAGGGPAQPVLWEFSTSQLTQPPREIQPAWHEHPSFTEHSYRSLAADRTNRELILFQNIGYTHAEWAFLDRDGRWSAQGELKWPWGAEYDKPQPIRVCYPAVALKDRAVYFCGVSDILEPYTKWREAKKRLTGQEWDYEFRRLFFTWSPDIRTGKFADWIEIASRDRTCGWITPFDLWVAPDGAVHLLWTERAIDERLRKEFFPTERQSHALNYAVVRDGQVVLRRTLLEAREGASEIPEAARFQVTPDNRLIVFYYVQGKDSAGRPVSENRVMEIDTNAAPGPAVRVALKAPFTNWFTASGRAGSAPSTTLDLLGEQAGKPNTISYARVRLW